MATNGQLERLAEAVYEDHPCDDGAACDIATALDCGLPLWAAHLLQGATECPHVDAVMAEINPTQAELDAECAVLVQHAHFTCRYCNGVTWCSLRDADELCAHCGEWTGPEAWFVLPYTWIGTDDVEFGHELIVRARCLEDAYETAEEYILDGTSDVWGTGLKGRSKGRTPTAQGIASITTPSRVTVATKGATRNPTPTIHRRCA